MTLLERSRASLQAAFTASFPVFEQVSSKLPVLVGLSSLALLFGGCGPPNEIPKPSITFTQVPPASGVGRSDVLEHIRGRILDGPPDTQVILYTHSKDTWFVQPFRSHPLTGVQSDGNWDNVTHLGVEYGALLVASGYKPPATILTLPPVSASVLAVSTTNGALSQEPHAQIIHFSGYDWEVRSSVDNKGGKVCNYEPSSIQVDAQGYLHLRIRRDGNQWFCSGISLTRSLGYGTYRFVVSDSVHIPPSAVLAMSTRADRQDDEDKSGVAIELSKWGKTRSVNADFVVQPYYIPGNMAHFEVPAGPMTYVLRWDPGTAAFKAFAGDSTADRSKVTDHVFKSGVPVPATEAIQLQFFDSNHPQDELQGSTEIVVQRFEYLP